MDGKEEKEEAKYVLVSDDYYSVTIRGKEAPKHRVKESPSHVANVNIHFTDTRKAKCVFATTSSKSHSE